MGSESVVNRNSGGGGGVKAVKEVVTTAKNVVAAVKEIVNCTEQEIYDVLRECDMDPNLAVEKLLSQDTFREVRSKREKRKEMKEATETRPKSKSTGYKGSKISIVNDPGVVQSGFQHAAYKEHGKAVDKQEVGSVGASVTSSTAHYVAKNTKVDSLSTDNGRQSLVSGVSMSDTAQVSQASQPWSVGVSKGHLSMADIVRMGTASQDTISHNDCNSLGVSLSGNLESNLSLPYQNNSELQGFHDKWPVIEQPITGDAQTLNMSSSPKANGPFEHPNLHVTEVSLHRNCNLGAAQVSHEEIASGDNAISAKIEPASISNNARPGSHSNSNLKNTPTSNFCGSYEHHEGVSSVVSDLQRLSMKDSNLEEDTVVLPNHLQALGAECSHLSFGTYKGVNNSASSEIFAPNKLSRSRLEMKSAAVDDSLAQFPHASSLNHGDEQFGFDVLKGTSGDQNYNPPAPWEELVKHTVSEKNLGHEYRTTASISDPSLRKSDWVTPSLTLKQPGLQRGNNSSFPGELHNNSNSQDLLAFLLAQSQRARHINAEPSRNNFPLSMSEDMEPSTFGLHNRSAPAQSFTMQPNNHFQQLPDMKAYQSVPQSQSYFANIDSQRAFSDTTAYNISPANMNYNNLLQNRNEFHMSRLPQSIASNAHGYGNLDSSVYYPEGFLSNPSVSNMNSSSNFSEISPSQYNGGHNFSSIQPHHDSFSHLDYGTKSRSSFLPEKTQYTFMDQPNQASMSQYASPEYSDFYPSWSQIPEQHNQSGGVQDLLPRQLNQFWQQNY